MPNETLMARANVNSNMDEANAMNRVFQPASRRRAKTISRVVAIAAKTGMKDGGANAFTSAVYSRNLFQASARPVIPSRGITAERKFNPSTMRKTKAAM